MRNISVVNQSPLLTMADLAPVLSALQIQVSRDFTPTWGVEVQLFGASGSNVPPGEKIYLLDDTTQADALGYHTLATGRPVGYVFVRTAQDAGDAWSATLSHELLEQLVDPYVYATAVTSWQGRQAAVALEVCDPVENDEYVINGIRVSNFVTPLWFLRGATAEPRYDFLQRLTAPLTMTSGGYVAYSQDLRHWQQTFGDRCPAHQRTSPRYSRRHRRGLRDDQRTLSA